MAVGLLVDDGVLSLSERLVDIFPEQKYRDTRFADITVEHLLSMSSGVLFGEIGVVTETEWTRAFFSSEMSFAPGERFAYNSMNSYILGKIVCKRAGTSLSELLKKRIFAPLGITHFLWEMGPEGIEKGGFGVYLSAESWAKLGIMMQKGGVYGGARVLSQKWVADSLTTRGISPESSGEFNYGYQIWVHRENDEFLFNGMLGQNVWVCPRNNAVVVITAGNNELFQQSPALYIVRKYLAGEISDDLKYRNVTLLRRAQERFFESRRYARVLSERRGVLCFLGFKEARPFADSWSTVLGKYRMRKNNDSLLPIFVRCMQNNLSAGIESIELLRAGERLMLHIAEGGADFQFEVGLYGFADTVLNFNGESYLARVAGEACYDAEGKPMYRIEIVYPELPNTRILELYISGEDTLLLKLYETPNNKIAEPFIESLTVTNPKLAFAKQMLERHFGSDFIKSKLARIFYPTLVLVRADSERADFVISYEEELAEADNKSIKGITSVLSRFMRDDEKLEDSGENTAEEDPGGIIGGILEKIKRFTQKRQ